MAEPGHDGKPRRRSCRGRGEESDGCVVPVKPRTKPTTNRWRRWWREGGRPEGRRAATHAPDSVPDTVCHRSCEPADWGCMGRQSPEPQSRWTFGRSPVRGSRTPGSARGGRGNPVPYRYTLDGVSTEFYRGSKQWRFAPLFLRPSREAHQYFSRGTLWKLRVTLCALDCLLLLPPPTRAVGQRHVGDHRLNPVTLRSQTAERSTK